ncbi:MAG: sulfurtransferase TusA family protein [Bacteroidales bacterium]|nr:sulfurtransferase TusA family protein [Bacteroidales bacterium]
MYVIPKSLVADIQYNQQQIEKYKNGEIGAKQFKAVRVPMGVYEQRQDGHYMLRIRSVGGLITPSQIKRVAEVAASVRASHIHVTTRQEFQLHDVSIDDVTPAMISLKEVGLSTQGGGGNTIRNILVNIQGGINSRQVFDPYPYAVALTSRLIEEKDSWTMPRKLKIAFDINEEDADLSLVADLGFIPKIIDGEKGFKVLLGGSVASNPHKGWLVFDFLPEKDLFRAAKAAKNFFNLNGNRKNRHKARIRHIFYKYGESETIKLYKEEFNKLLHDTSLDFVPADLQFNYETPRFEPIKDDGGEFILWKRRYASAQTLNKGRWSVFVPFLNGNIQAEKLLQIADFLDAFGNDVVRLTPRQSFQIRNVQEQYLPNIYHFFKTIGFPVDSPLIINNLTACTGADTCRLGICLPKGLEKAIANRLQKSGLNLDEIPDLKININGCPNSCAQNAWSDLGFSGRIGRKGDFPYPAYNVWARINGKQELAEVQGFVAAKDVPAFVESYLKHYLDVKSQYSSYDEFVRKDGNTVITNILESFSEIPDFEEDKNYYYDWGAKDVFSLASNGQAECSAGLFDIIELDQDTIKEKQAELLKPGVNVEKVLHDIVFSASRMLLVTRGLDPRTDDEVYDGFEQQFIKTGFVSETFLPVVEKARKGFSLRNDSVKVNALALRVNELYASMDDSLQFKIDNEETFKEQTKEQELKEKSQQTSDSVAKYDFRGVACPMNFVKTKVVLATMKHGSLLEILLDDGEPIKNVPGSVRLEGHEVLETSNVDDYWKVLIKKN